MIGLDPRTAAATAAIVALLLAGCGDDEETTDAGPAAEEFAPALTIEALGGTNRSANAGLAVRVEPRPEDANLRSATIALPTSFQVDADNLGSLCTERQLNADRCAGSTRLGSVSVNAPRVGGRFSGPVYAVTGSGGLPRLAFLLPGFLLRGDITTRGSQLQAGLEELPDLPIESFEFTIDGGRDGYLVLNTDICARPPVAEAALTGHSGETSRQRIVVEADC